jgi:hypothetical protein
MSGFAGVFTPRILPGLELGASRFFHEFWPVDGLSADQGPDGRTGDENQLASVFARWVLPASGIEAYAEYSRIDHAWDLLDLILEPDHATAYMLGVAKVWRRDDATLVAVRAEILNTQPSHLLRVRERGPIWYGHSEIRQGHTHRGQVLGSPAGFGGGGAVLAGDVYHQGGRLSMKLSRTRVKDNWPYWPTGLEDPRSTDVMHTASAAALLFVRGGADLSAGLAAVQNLNRNFDSDAFNLNATLGFRLGF